MSSIADHQILLAFVLLALLIIFGIVVVALRAVGLLRAAKRSQERVSVPVRAISDGLQSAERRVGELQDRQQDLSHIVEQVGVRTGELGRLMGVATAALAVLRSPLKYLGK